MLNKTTIIDTLKATLETWEGFNLFEKTFKGDELYIFKVSVKATEVSRSLQHLLDGNELLDVEVSIQFQATQGLRNISQATNGKAMVLYENLCHFLDFCKLILNSFWIGHRHQVTQLRLSLFSLQVFCELVLDLVKF